MNTPGTPETQAGGELTLSPCKVVHSLKRGLLERYISRTSALKTRRVCNTSGSTVSVFVLWVCETPPNKPNPTSPPKCLPPTLLLVCVLNDVDNIPVELKETYDKNQLKKDLTVIQKTSTKWEKGECRWVKVFLFGEKLLRGTAISLQKLKGEEYKKRDVGKVYTSEELRKLPSLSTRFLASSAITLCLPGFDTANDLLPSQVFTTPKLKDERQNVFLAVKMSEEPTMDTAALDCSTMEHEITFIKESTNSTTHIKRTWLSAEFGDSGGYPFVINPKDPNPLYCSLQFYEDSLLQAFGIVNPEVWRSLACAFLSNMRGIVVGNTIYNASAAVPDDTCAIQVTDMYVDLPYLLKKVGVQISSEEARLQLGDGADSVFSGRNPLYEKRNNRDSCAVNLSEYSGTFKRYFDNPQWVLYLIGRCKYIYAVKVSEAAIEAALANCGSLDLD